MAKTRKVIFYDETNFIHRGPGDELENINQTLNNDGIYFTPADEDNHHIGHAGYIYTLGSKVIDTIDNAKPVFVTNTYDPNEYIKANENISVITSIKSNEFEKTINVHQSKLDFGFLVRTINDIIKKQVKLVKFYANIPNESGLRLIDVVALNGNKLSPGDLPSRESVNMYLPIGSSKTFEGWSTSNGGTANPDITNNGIVVYENLNLYATFSDSNLGQHQITGFEAKSPIYGVESLLVNKGTCTTGGTIQYTVLSPNNEEIHNLKVNEAGVPYNKYEDGNYLDAYDVNGSQIKYIVTAHVPSDANYTQKTLSVEVTISKGNSSITCNRTGSSSAPIELTIGEPSTFNLTLNNCTLGSNSISTLDGVSVSTSGKTLSITANKDVNGHITITGIAASHNYKNPEPFNIYIKAEKINTEIKAVPSSVTVKHNESTTVTLSGNNISEFSISQWDSNIANVNINNNTKTLTITGVAEGNTSVVVSGTVTDSNKYNTPADKTVSIAVIDDVDYGYYSFNAKSTEEIRNLTASDFKQLKSNISEVNCDVTGGLPCVLTTGTTAPKIRIFNEKFGSYGNQGTLLRAGSLTVTINNKTYNVWYSNTATGGNLIKAEISL